MKLRSLVSCLAALLAVPSTISCVGVPSEPRSSVQLEMPWGVAGGKTVEDAQRVGELVEQVFFVYREIEEFTPPPLRIHLADVPVREGVGGITVSRSGRTTWIAIRPSSANVPRTVAHEMAHACFPDVHDVLPAPLREGLCELLAARVFPDEDRFQQLIVVAAAGYLDRFTVHVLGDEAKRSLKYLVRDVAPIDEVLLLDWHGHLNLDDRTLANNYGFGWMLALVIGYEGIVELARRTHRDELEMVPASWVLTAAGIDPPSQENLNRAFAQVMGIEPSPGGRLIITLGED